MSSYLVTKSFHQFSVVSKNFIFFIITLISFYHNAYSSELDNLFLKLKLSDNAESARNYESEIWKIWLNNGSSDVSNNQMQLNYVNRGRMGVLLQFQGNANCGSCSGK